MITTKIEAMKKRLEQALHGWLMYDADAAQLGRLLDLLIEFDWED